MGDDIGRDSNTIIGNHNTLTTGASTTVSVDEAARELREFLAEMSRRGHLTADGVVARPAELVQEVQARRGRLTHLVAAVRGGAKQAVLAAVEGGAAAIVVGLLGG